MKSYEVKINGKRVQTQEARVSAIPFNQPWPGYQRPLWQTELCRFVTVAQPLPVTVEVLPTVQPQWYDDESAQFRVLPQSKNIPLSWQGDRATFTVNAYGQYVLDKDGHSPLCVFVSLPEEETALDDVTYKFTDGVYEVGKLCLHSGDSVYIGKNAVVRGSLYAENASDIRIFGSGILDGGYEERTDMNCYAADTVGTFKMYGCRNVSVEGIVLRDSAVWVINLFGCEDVTLRDLKLIGHWKYNTDGVDIVNSRRVLVENCFIRAFDDGITLKGIDRYSHIDVEDITVRGCVLWCGWGRTLEIGLETACAQYRNILFVDCDLIYNSAVALDIQNGDYADVHDVRFSDIRVEYRRNTLPEVLQHNPSDFYEHGDRYAVPALIGIENPKYNFEDHHVLNVRRAQFGNVYDIVFENIRAFGDSDTPEIFINNHGNGNEVRDIILQNVTFNGKPYEYTQIRSNIAQKNIKIR